MEAVEEGLMRSSASRRPAGRSADKPGILAEVPIAMVLFSLLLARRLGRPITFLAAAVTTATMLSFAPRDMDDLFHLAAQLTAMAAIVRTAWRWPEDGRPTAGARG